MNAAAAAALTLWASLALNPLATYAAERIGAGMPVAVRADWPSDEQLHYPQVRMP